MAPGLVAGRQDEGPAAVSCRAPTSDQWFTGLGAAARHQSVLELVNPDPGPAVADITLVGPRDRSTPRACAASPCRAAGACGVDLSEETRIRGELAAHVVVSRGRLGAYAADSFDELGRGEAGEDWLAAQDAGDDLTLLGLPPGVGTRVLVVANDGDDEARAVVGVVTKDSTFRPEGLDEVRVPPGQSSGSPSPASSARRCRTARSVRSSRPRTRSRPRSARSSTATSRTPYPCRASPRRPR